jgi:two-component system chemotaxis response regulator CheB
VSVELAQATQGTDNLDNAQLLSVLLAFKKGDFSARIKALGGVVVIQDPATAESPVMPAAAIESTDVDKVLGPAEIGAFLTQLTQTRS